MKIYDVKHCRACATSAMRDAKNGMDIIKQIEKKTGVHIDIIDGQEEAKIIYNNHVEHMEDQKGNYMYVDVGGGSTEINLLSEGQLVCSRSYNIGTVRMLNNAVKDSEWERLKNDLAELAKSYPQTNIIGSGGNINKLYRSCRQEEQEENDHAGFRLTGVAHTPESAFSGRTYGTVRHETRPRGCNHSGW